MLNINQKVEVTLSPNNMQYYKNKGYNIDILKQKSKNNKLAIPKGTTILVNLVDLPLKSHAYIHITCDYCGKDITKEFSVYNDQKQKSFLNKDACEGCKHLKVNESNTIRYGNKSHFIKPDIHEIKNQFEEKKYMLISEEYVDVHTPLEYICLKHIDKGILNIAYAQFKMGCGCKYCGYENSAEKQRNDYSDFQEEFLERGLIPITEKIVSYEDYVEYICPIHEDKGIRKISYAKFKSGQGCKFCGIDRMADVCRHDIEQVREKFKEKGYILISNTYINNQQLLQFICEKHKEEGIQLASYDKVSQNVQVCKYCYKESHSGENHWAWKGGVSELKTYLYSVLLDWKKDSMKSCNYKCIITGKRFDDIHHLYSFSFIFYEIFDYLNIKIKVKISEYTQDELELIKNKCIELHKQYPLGVCLTNEVHILFHKEYGYGQNTPEQFEEFKQNYFNGKYNDILAGD